MQQRESSGSSFTTAVSLALCLLTRCSVVLGAFVVSYLTHRVDDSFPMATSNHRLSYLSSLSSDFSMEISSAESESLSISGAAVGWIVSSIGLLMSSPEG
ncbi:hypothetical protein HA466_0102640 [Hirschfeldia incana]|nr:hypothetical protein HA466_0102640 [Hirschfeldia incana]